MANGFDLILHYWSGKIRQRLPTHNRSGIAIDQRACDLDGLFLGVAGGESHDFIGHFFGDVVEAGSGHLAIFFLMASAVQ